MNYLKRGFKYTFQAIRKNKLIFLLLLALQIITLVSLAFSSVHYQVKIFEDLEKVVGPLEQANYDAESIKAGEPFMENIYEVYMSYKSMTKNIYEFALLLLGIFLILNGASWVLTHQLLKTKLKEIPQQWLKFIISTLALIVPFLIICYLLIKGLTAIGIGLESFGVIAQILVYSSFVLYYFLLVSFTFIDYKSWKTFLKKFYFCSIKKIYLTLIVLLINLILFLASLYLIYINLSNERFPLMMLFSLIFVIVLVILRIYWVVCLRLISHKK